MLYAAGNGVIIDDSEGNAGDRTELIREEDVIIFVHGAIDDESDFDATRGSLFDGFDDMSERGFSIGSERRIKFVEIDRILGRMNGIEPDGADVLNEVVVQGSFLWPGFVEEDRRLLRGRDGDLCEFFWSGVGCCSTSAGGVIGFSGIERLSELSARVFACGGVGVWRV